jgi:hypothetical protein
MFFQKMKSNFFALFASLIFFASCQKENLLEPTAILQPADNSSALTSTIKPQGNPESFVSAQVWTLLEENWTATTTSNLAGAQTLTLQSGSQNMTASQLDPSKLPSQVLSILAALPVQLDADSKAWRIDGGGHMVVVKQPNGLQTRVFWFDSFDNFKALGFVRQ